eukprot:4697316-Pyramimonas_sp.AAC.1
MLRFAARRIVGSVPIASALRAGQCCDPDVLKSSKSVVPVEFQFHQPGISRYLHTTPLLENNGASLAQLLYVSYELRHGADQYRMCLVAWSDRAFNISGAEQRERIDDTVEACERITKIGAFSNVGLAGGKYVHPLTQTVWRGAQAIAGFISGSPAIVADALHSLSDLISGESRRFSELT